MFWTVSRTHERLWYLLTTQMHSFIQGLHSHTESWFSPWKSTILVFKNYQQQEEKSIVLSQRSRHFVNSTQCNKAKRRKTLLSQETKMNHTVQEEDRWLGEVLVAIGQFTKLPWTAWITMEGDLWLWKVTKLCMRAPLSVWKHSWRGKKGAHVSRRSSRRDDGRWWRWKNKQAWPKKVLYNHNKMTIKQLRRARNPRRDIPATPQEIKTQHKAQWCPCESTVNTTDRSKPPSLDHFV